MTSSCTPLCYLVAPSYSGTTLLTFLLNTHPGIATVGELKAKLGRGTLRVPEVCSCGLRMRECSFWQRVCGELSRDSINFDFTDFGTHFESQSSFLAHRLLRARVRRREFEGLREFMIRRIPSARRELQRILERQRLLIEVMTRLQCGTVFLDSSKDCIRLKFLLQSGFWRTKVIHLVRDGRGTAYSYMRRTGRSMRKAALFWRRPHQQFARIAAGLAPGQWIRVRYEALATEPEETAGEVLDFLDLDRRKFSLDFRDAEHHIIGNPMRLDTADHIAVDVRWKQNLSQDHLEVFDRVAGRLNRQFGYGD